MRYATGGAKVELITAGIGAAHVWLLFMLRTLGFVAIAPLFSARAAPPPFRIVLVFFLATLAFSAWAPGLTSTVDATSAQFIPAAISELVLGMMLGFIVGMDILGSLSS